MTNLERGERFHLVEERSDQRTPGQRDRDRVLHSSALRRLAGVTQVVSPAEAPISHNRLTHTLKVAQIASRMAQKLTGEQAGEAEALGIDPDVVEAASLAHDLGHPPFGHVAERVLDDLMFSKNSLAGFEGNAQSFRIVTKLALRRLSSPGLNLTRATLAAMLKYPWIRSSAPKQARKWGAYDTELDELEWARKLMPHDLRKTAESALMDWADDIAYSVHDVEDFYKAGLIPLDRLVNVPDERDGFLQALFERWEANNIKVLVSKDTLIRVCHELFDVLDVTEPYWGTRDQRGRLRQMTSYLIDRYISSIRLNSPSGPDDEFVQIVSDQKMEITILKELTWTYVINNPALARQQFGKARIIRDLFNIFIAEAKSNQEILPIGCREHLQEELENAYSGQHETIIKRVVADAICSLTDNEAIRIYRSLVGADSDVIFDNSRV